MDLVTPGIGLIVWSSIIFLILIILMKKFAWSPILKTVNDREDTIKEAINQAKLAREEMAQLKAENENILKEARIERDNMLKEAREMKDKIVSDAKNAAGEEANKMINNAKSVIENEKLAAVTELKNQVANLSIDIAEKVLKSELNDKSKQQQLVQDLIKESKLN